MSEDEKKIIVDDDWKAEAQREKQKLEEETRARAQAPRLEGGFAELLNLLAMQAVVGLGGMATPTGERIPPNLETAKHFIDLIEVLDEKTTGNLSEDEKKILDQTIYELRMIYVQAATGGGAGGMAPPTGRPSTE
ncbi:MAG: DUF1844 domain-containing protein [Phycisphaerae bacterium]